MIDEENIENFFSAIAAYSSSSDAVFTYVAVKNDGNLAILQARLLLNATPSFHQHRFESQNVQAGAYSLQELGPDARGLVAQLMTGGVTTPHGHLDFPADNTGRHRAFFQPFHPEGLKSQRRINTLRLIGADCHRFIKQPHLDWELRAAATPYDGLQDLLAEFQCGPLDTSNINFEAIAFNALAIDGASKVSGTEALIDVLLLNRLPIEKVTVGYRVFDGGKIIDRATLNGDDFDWTIDTSFRRGRAKISVPNAAIVHAFANYDGNTQYYWWITDPTTTQNSRRTIYETFDSNLSVLSDFIAKPAGKGNARDLEFGVAWLFWILGFSVAHLGGTSRTQDAADLIATTPEGHFAVIECTTGLLKTDNKLPLLISRSTNVRAQLERSNNRHLRVLPVIVTSKTRDEIRADIEQAERLGVLVMTREDLEEGIRRSLVLPDAERFYADAEQEVRQAQSKFDAGLAGST